jgi:hypothetical protein
MGERGTSSQVSVVFESHGWLEVEEGKNERDLLLGGERRSEEYQPESLSRGPCSPFYQTRGANYINAMGQVRREERRRVCMSNRCTGELLTHAACRVVPVCCRCCMWLPVLVPPPHMQEVETMNASHTWHMHGK